MITIREIPLFGAGVFGKSAVVTRQRRLNCYVENRPDGDKSKAVIYGTPGLVPAFFAGAQFPVRGMLGTQSALYVVAFNVFQSLRSNGTVAFNSNVSSQSGNVTFANSTTQVLIADGQVGYLYTPAAGTFVPLPASYPTNAKTVTFCSGFFVAEQPGTQKFWVSNAFDGSTWNSLAFASASAFTDNILAVDNLLGNLVVFSEQHFEQWQNSGFVPQPFAPILSATQPYGLSAIFSRVKVGDRLLFLAQNQQGQAQFVQIQGFSSRVVSSPDIDYIVNSFPTVSDCVGLSYGADNHKFCQWTFPSASGGAGRSFLYDITTDIWSETQTGPSVNPVRHTGNFSTYYGGSTLISDYKTNQIYKLDPNTYTDNGVTVAREIITRHLSSSFNRIRVSNLYIDMETGVGLQNAQGSQPQVMLQYSKDNGRTWSGERWASLGNVGTYLNRVVWRRFGSSRDCTFRIRITEPCKFVITAGALKVRQKAAA